jgi:hypothetical protein
LQQFLASKKSKGSVDVRRKPAVSENPLHFKVASVNTHEVDAALAHGVAIAPGYEGGALPSVGDQPAEQQLQPAAASGAQAESSAIPQASGSGSGASNGASAAAAAPAAGGGQGSATSSGASNSPGLSAPVGGAAPESGAAAPEGAAAASIGGAAPEAGAAASQPEETATALPESMCPDGSDALLDESTKKPLVCGTGLDGHELCPRRYYCSIEPERKGERATHQHMHILLLFLARLCCPILMISAGFRYPKQGDPPYFGHRKSNPGEVVERGSLPSDPKPKKVPLPKVHPKMGKNSSKIEFAKNLKICQKFVKIDRRLKNVFLTLIQGRGYVY